MESCIVETFGIIDMLSGVGIDVSMKVICTGKAVFVRISVSG